MNNINNRLNLLQNNTSNLSAADVAPLTSSRTTRVVQVSMEAQRAERGEKRPAQLMSQSVTQESVQSDSKRQSVHNARVNTPLSTASDNSNTGPIPPHSIDNGITSLLQAVEQGQEERVKALMSPANINLHDAFGQTALMVAMANGQIAIVELLLNAGAKTDVYIQISRQSAEGPLKITPLIFAARCGHHDILKLLLKNGADKEARDNEERTALHHAINGRQTEIVKLLIHADASLEAQSRQGQTPLMRAAGCGHKESVEFLLEKSANIEARDDEERTALHHAITTGHTEIVQLLIHAGASREARSRQGHTCLMLAAGCGHKEIVEFFLEKSADIEARDDEERTALHYAINRGHTEIVKLLIHAGASREVQSKANYTLLMRAAGCGHKDIVEFLLEKSADIEARDDEERTALHYAINRGHTEIVKLLIHAGASREVRSKANYTLLMRAAGFGHKDIVEFLLEKSANIEARDDEERTALHHAITTGHTEIVKLLIHAGASREVRDRENYTCLILAASCGHKEIVEFLLEKSANIEARDNKERTALHHAINRGHTEIVEFLLEKGADKEARDNEERTGLHYAINRGHTEIVELLIHAGASLEAHDRQGCTLLIYATAYGKKDIVKLLLTKNVDKEACDSRNATALHYAARHGQTEIVELLINADANTNARSCNGETPLKMAVSTGNSDLVTLLIRHGADVNICDSEECGILAYAVRRMDPEMVRLLLIEGADGCKVDSKGDTAVSIARSKHTAVSMHHASNEEPEVVRKITEILRILANTPDRITGMTTFMTAAKKGDYETAETLVRYTSNMNVDVRMGGNLALENGHAWTARQLYKMINTPVNNVRFTLQCRGAQFNHRVYDNKLYLDVDRQKVDIQLAMNYLYLVSRYLTHFKKESVGQFGDLSLNIKFTNEEGIDEGGLTAEFITLLFTTLFTGEHPFSLFTKSGNGTYLLGFEEENPSFTNSDSERCKDLGILLGAIFSGFPESSEGCYYKIPTIFANHFYKQLLAVCKYTADKELVPFEEMTPEDKEAFTKLVSDNDLDNEYYKNIDHNFEKQTYDDRELTQILHFIIIDYMECNEKDKTIYSTLQDLLEQFINIPEDPIKLIHMQLDTERNDPSNDLNMQLRSTLRSLLAENTFSADLKKRFVVSREERYAHVCTALAMIGQGFIHADQDFIAVMMEQFERDPLIAAEKLAVCIQGEPITHETFVKLLKRSIVDDEIEPDDSTAIEQKIAWLTEWCETGVHSTDGEQERRATIEEIKAVLHCITGLNTITDQIVFTFAQPVNGMSEFHTCDHAVNFGSFALQHTDKVAFIEAWMNHVHSALDSGGFTIL